jgi:ATP-dependent Zn protease
VLECRLAASPTLEERNPGEFDRQSDHVLGLYRHLLHAALGRDVEERKHGGKDAEISYSDLFNKVKQGQVLDAEVQGAELHGHMKANPKEQFHTHVGEHYEGLETAFLASDAHFSKKAEQSNLPLQVLFNVGPILLFGFIFFFFMRQMQSGGNKALSFGKSRARLLSMQQKRSPSRTWPAWMRPRKS